MEKSKMRKIVENYCFLFVCFRIGSLRTIGMSDYEQ